MGAFRPLVKKSVRWRPIEGTGLEHLTVGIEGDAIVARSVLIGERGGAPYGVHYMVACDADWTVRKLELETTDNRRLSLASDGRGHWTDHRREPLPEFDDCIDIDLAGTPFTNTLPIRRVDPSDVAELAMLYVPFDTFSPMVDLQRYRCLERGRLYRYEAMDRTFAADLPVDEDGFVRDNPTLYYRV
jgi:hypothetical protein